MSNQEKYDYSFVEAAAREFMEQNPAYIATAANFKILTDEVSKLIEEDNADPQTVAVFTKAFHRCQDKLTLKVADPIKTFDEMTPEELSALPDKEKDLLPDHLLKRLANWELQQSRKRPEPSEADLILRPLFGDEGFADSTKNRAIIGGWMNKRGLGYSLSNLRLAIDACSEHLEPSAQALEQMSAAEFRKSVVEPEFARKQAAQKPRERNFPAGTRYTSFLHNQ